MKRIVISMLLIVLSFLYCALLSADVKVVKFSGTVTIYKNSIWNNANAGDILGQQDKIKTGSASRAELLMDGTSRIWINENSEVEMNSLGADNIFKLILGKIRNRIKACFHRCLLYSGNGMWGRLVGAHRASR